MLKFFKKETKNTTTPFTIWDIEESFTIADITQTLSEWEYATSENLKIDALIVINNKITGAHKKGEIIEVETVTLQDGTTAYKGKQVGGIYKVPNQNEIKDLIDGNMLYAPYFQK